MKFPIVVLVLFLGAAVPLARQLLFGAGLLDDDVFEASLPAWEWLSRSLRSGDSVLWSPNLLGGFPLAFSEYPFLSPPVLLLAWILAPPQAYAWSLVLHLLAAGLLTYSFCRVQGLGGGASLLAAVSFQMSSEVVVGMSGFAALGMFALPASLLAVELALRGGWRGALPLPVVVGAALLAGHPQPAVLSLGSGALYALFRWCLLLRAGEAHEGMAFAARLALGALLGVAMAGVRLLPQLEMVGLSTRSAGLPLETATGGALTLQGLLIGYLLPLSKIQALPWGAPSYAGPAVVLLVGLGLRHLGSRPVGRFLLGLGAVAALMSLGPATPLHHLTGLPLLSFFREPSRFALVTTFALAVLAGMALDDRLAQARRASPAALRKMMLVTLLVCLLTATFFGLAAFYRLGSGPLADGFRSWTHSHSLEALSPLRPRMGLAALGLPIAAFALALSSMGRLSRGRLAASLLAVSFTVLVLVGAILQPAIDARVLAKVPESVRLLRAQAEQYRVLSNTPGIHLYNYLRYLNLTREAAFQDDLRYRYKAELLASNHFLRWRIPSIDGYENFHSRYQEVMLRHIGSQHVSRWVSGELSPWARRSWQERLRVLSMLNVRYLVSPVDLSPQVAELRPVARWQLEARGTSRVSPTFFLMENPGALPRYYLVPRAKWLPVDSPTADMDSFRAVALGEVDPASMVLLHGPNGDASPHDEPVSRPAAAGGKPSVEVVRSRNAEVAVRVTTNRPAYLVTSDSYWPGWKAFVEGRETPVLRANVTGRAVRLEGAGTQTVVFRFEPPLYGPGLAISLVAALLWVGWLAASLRRRTA